jgi:hypothetical protein
LRHLFSYGCLSYFLWLRSKYNCMKPFLSWCLIFIIFFFVLFSWILFCFLLDQNYFKAAVFSFVIKFNNWYPLIVWMTFFFLLLFVILIMWSFG